MNRKTWNTWNVRSIMSHALISEGFCISFGILNYNKKAPKRSKWLREALIGRSGASEQITPGLHAYDGSYTSLELTWQGTTIFVETAVINSHLYARITPVQISSQSASLSIEASILWGRPGKCYSSENALILENKQKSVKVNATGPSIFPKSGNKYPKACMFRNLEETILISSDSEALYNTATIIDKQKKIFQSSRVKFGKNQDLCNAMQSCLAWNTIYDSTADRIISPVSRIWSCERGWVLFEWDSYFAAWIAAIEDKELAYANARAVTNEISTYGFVPNGVQGDGYASRDRSQPPVGSITVQALCDLFDETVLAEELFDKLFIWNRWWTKNRDNKGYLCWGSNPDYRQPLKTLQIWRLFAIHSRHGAALESGLDNSPMYDNMPFNKRKNIMELADVGLMSLYIADCNALADIAIRIKRFTDADELKQRAKTYSEKLAGMWDEHTGLYLNRNLKTGKFEKRLSPTHFYPLLSGVPSQEQADRMLNEHFFNEKEFWGKWILPSISRNDPAYKDQTYWRGRIWAPMNFLVYLGLKKYNNPKARLSLVEKSATLLRKEWHEMGHVHENYCADTGQGCNDVRSDSFYHWGGLLGLISLLEELDN